MWSVAGVKTLLMQKAAGALRHSAWSALSRAWLHQEQPRADLESGGWSELGRLGRLQSAVLRRPPRSRCEWPTLTYQQRLIGFTMCSASGLLISSSAVMSLTSLLLGNPMPLAIKFSLGNVLSIAAVGFLVGPRSLGMTLLARERRLASLLYLGSLCITFVSILVWHSRILTLVSLCIQLAAVLWFTFSYLPFGHTALRRLLRLVV